MRNVIRNPYEYIFITNLSCGEPNMNVPERVEIMRGKHKRPKELFGPIPGVRLGDVVAYDVELPESFEPWPGRSRVERTFVLLDAGVSFADVCWGRHHLPNGQIIKGDAAGTWYVDLISVKQIESRYTFLDLYIDLMVPVDGRHYRMLDLDEFADALAEGRLSTTDAVDALRRWQAFLDRYIHFNRFPQNCWSDFPPAAIKPLLDMNKPFGKPVQWHE